MSKHKIEPIEPIELKLDFSKQMKFKFGYKSSRNVTIHFYKLFRLFFLTYFVTIIVFITKWTMRLLSCLKPDHFIFWINCHKNEIIENWCNRLLTSACFSQICTLLLYEANCSKKECAYNKAFTVICLIFLNSKILLEILSNNKNLKNNLPNTYFFGNIQREI